MTPLVQKVIERFVYEGLLLHNQFQGRRWRITLEEALHAGEVEPRILEILPTIFLYRPSIIYKGQRDVVKYPDLKNILKKLDTKVPSERWRGIPIGDIRKAASRISKLIQWKQQKKRWRNINIRISEEELESFNKLAAHFQTSKSELIRSWITRDSSAYAFRND